MESDRFLSEPSFDSLAGLARNVALSGIAGLFTGILVGGIGGRLFMRIAGAAAPQSAQGRGTEAGFTVGELTVGGTLALVLFIGIFVGIVGAILFVITAPWLSWAGKGSGGLFGLVLLAIGSATSDFMNPDNIDFLVLKNSALLVVMIFLLFVAFGLVIVGVFGFLDRKFPRVEGRNALIKAPYIMISLVGLLAFVSFLPLFFIDSFCQCEPPIAASFAMVLMGIGTLVWWSTALIRVLPSWSLRLSAMLGYLGLVGVLVFGLLRAIQDAIEIID